jgi:hypothetical protein
MRFEQKTQFGLLGETLFLDLIRFQESKGFDGTIDVRPNTGPGFLKGFGHRYLSSDGTSEVIPDIEIVKRPYLKPITTEFAEIKTKTAFCTWCNGNISEAVKWSNDNWEIRTGIDVKICHSYSWYWQKHYQNLLHLIFVHPLDVVQLRNRQGIIQPGIAGIYRAELSQLFDLAKHGAGKRFGNMIYWPISSFKRWRSAKYLATNETTKNIWAELVAEATKFSQRIKLIDPETEIQMT